MAHKIKIILKDEAFLNVGRAMGTVGESDLTAFASSALVNFADAILRSHKHSKPAQTTQESTNTKQQHTNV